MDNIKIINKNTCNGCGSCYNVCPTGTIQMQENNEGFKYPVIDNEKCTNCGLCLKVCSVKNSKYENKKKPDCYAYVSPDNIRINSTSGGAFYVLAKEFITRGDYVAGAVWTENGGVEHIVSDRLEDVEKMRKSKYLQSDINDCFMQIKTILDKDKKVLFTGTPCQVAGLKSYLRKDYENLYCVDLICHGVPSPKVFKKYINEKYINDNNEKWLNTDFRNKIAKDASFLTTTTTAKIVSSSSQKDDFMRLFLNDVILRESCSNCKFQTIPRQGDMTIGDFWGINKFNKKFDDGLGISLILSNNKQGNFLIKILKKEAKIIKKVPIKYAIKGNPVLTHPVCPHKKRNDFFDNIDKLSIKENKERILDNKCDCMITNLWRTVNYGAVLTCFGVQCLCESFGLNPKVINFVLDDPPHASYEGSFTEQFANKYLNLTSECKTYEDLVNLNNFCQCFITGSDQVFAPWIMDDYHSSRSGPSYYLLNFAKSNSKKISYAASFGVDSYDVDIHTKQIFKHYISQFDSVSVREDSGVDILKKCFDVEAQHLLDGVFHIPKNKLIKMTESYEKQDNYILYFGLPKFRKQKWINKILETISKKMKLPVKYIDFNTKMSVEEWLSYIKNANFVISNSYHTIVFAIIFNTPFLQIVQAENTQTRFNSLFKMFGIYNKSVTKYDVNLDYDQLLSEFNWDYINIQIDKLIRVSRDWFQAAINIDKKTINNNLDTLNYILNQQYFNQKRMSLLSNKNKIYRKYYKYKILSKLVIGRKRESYFSKMKQYKTYVSKIRNIVKL